MGFCAGKLVEYATVRGRSKTTWHGRLRRGACLTHTCHGFGEGGHAIGFAASAGSMANGGALPGFKSVWHDKRNGGELMTFSYVTLRSSTVVVLQRRKHNSSPLRK